MDIMMNSSHRKYLPKTWGRVADEGIVFNNMAVSMAQCCPSRVSAVTGKLVHIHNVTSSEPPHGGAKKFVDEEMDREYVPVWMQRQGYRTYVTGKWLNQFGRKLVDRRCPRGWDVFDGMLGDGSFDEWYFKPIFSNNCNGVWSPNGTYHQTDIIRDKALSYIDDAVERDEPFFISLYPTAPHDQGLGKVAVPCARHAGMYRNENLPRTPNWGVRLPANMGMRDNVDMGFSNSKYIPRLESLAGVDEMMDAIVTRLEEQGVLNDTYVIFTSDNGFHLGHHSLSYEKYTPYEEDVRVPFFIRGPGLPKGIMTDYQMTMVDLSATIMQLAGFDLSEKQWYDTLDGVPIPFAALNSTISVSVNSGPPRVFPPSPPHPPAPPTPPAAPKFVWPQRDASGNFIVEPSPPPAYPPPPPAYPPPSPMPSPPAPRRAPSPAVAKAPPPAPRPPLPVLPPPPPPAAGEGWGIARTLKASGHHDGADASGEGAGIDTPIGGDAPLSSFDWAPSWPRPAYRHSPGIELDDAYYEDDGVDDDEVVQAVEAELMRQALTADASFDIEYYEPSDEEISLHLAQVIREMGGQVNPLLHYRTANASQGRMLVERNSTLAGQASSASRDLPAVIRDTIILEGWLDVRMSTYYRKNFKAVRVCAPLYVFGFSKTYMSVTCYKYAVWCIPENRYNALDNLNLNEMYDLGLDPYELNNRLKDTSTNANAARLVNRLDAVLTVMAYCDGPSCRNPWRVLHADGGANSLIEAMSPVFDDFYAARRKFAFTMCDVKYLKENELADADILHALSLQNSTSF
ncbi:hypothetical protein FOA52_012295 [Chlamydomonas sp. UWO 241]|nr:hypothetical protein FOA52_012295 [Chlamydomonas sp. UWO 241]